MLDLRTLTRPTSPNHYLIGPRGFTGPAPDESAPEFDLTAARLYELARRLALSQPRTKLLEDAPESLSFEIRQRTKLWRFPDDITVEAVPLGEGRAALALYSRSRCGYSDFDVNRRRARR